MNSMVNRIMATAGFLFALGCGSGRADVLFVDQFQQSVYTAGPLGRTGSMRVWTRTGNVLHKENPLAGDGHVTSMESYGAGTNRFWRTVNTRLYNGITIEVKAFQAGTVSAQPATDRVRIEVDTGAGFVTLLEDTGIWDGAGTNETAGLLTDRVLSTGELPLPATAANSTNVVVRIENTGNNARVFLIDSLTIRGTLMQAEVLFSDVFELGPKVVGSTGRAGYHEGWTQAWTVHEVSWGQFFYDANTNAVDGHAMRVEGNNSEVYPHATRTISTKGFDNIAFKLSAFQNAIQSHPAHWFAVQVDTGNGFVDVLQDLATWDGGENVLGAGASRQTPLFTPHYFSLGPEAANHPAVQIRLAWSFGSTRAYFIDSIEVRGLALPPRGTVIVVK